MKNKKIQLFLRGITAVLIINILILLFGDMRSVIIKLDKLNWIQFSIFIWISGVACYVEIILLLLLITKVKKIFDRMFLTPEMSSEIDITQEVFDWILAKDVQQ